MTTTPDNKHETAAQTKAHEAADAKAHDAAVHEQAARDAAAHELLLHPKPRIFKPMGKDAAIVLNASTRGDGTTGFGVVEVTGALEPLPGTTLTQEEAQMLVKDSAWAVTVKRGIGT